MVLEQSAGKMSPDLLSLAGYPVSQGIIYIYITFSKLLQHYTKVKEIVWIFVLFKNKKKEKYLKKYLTLQAGNVDELLAKNV